MRNAPSPTLDDKRKQWLEALNGDDRHAIVRQLIQMSWDSASFRAVNEARRLAPADPDGGVQLNGLMHSLIDRGFFTMQVVAVRRLMDSYPLKGKKGVYSLTGLLADLRKHRNLLCRRAIFDVEGLSYDYEPIRQKLCEYVRERHVAREHAYFVPRELVWERHEDRHKVIDTLSGTDAAKRTPGDTIEDSLLANLQAKVQAACKDLIDHATKYIAHAATPESRAIVNADNASITLKHLWVVHKHLCQVASFISIYILGDACPGFLAAPQFDQFKYIDRPLIDSSQIGQLESVWNSFDTECHAWSQWGLDEYAKEFR